MITRRGRAVMILAVDMAIKSKQNGLSKRSIVRSRIQTHKRIKYPCYIATPITRNRAMCNSSTAAANWDSSPAYHKKFGAANEKGPNVSPIIPKARENSDLITSDTAIAQHVPNQSSELSLSPSFHLFCCYRCSTATRRVPLSNMPVNLTNFPIKCYWDWSN